MMQEVVGSTRMLAKARVVVFILAFALVAADAVAREKVTVFLRIDDIFTSTTDIRPIDNDAFLKVAEKHGAKVVLATVPNRLLQPHINKDGHMAHALLDYADRGHQIIVHGYNHQCPYSLGSGREFSTSESLRMMTREQRVAKMVEGKRLLEAVIGRTITGYCGPGGDDPDLLGGDAKLMRENGFVWLKDAPSETPVIHEDGGASYPTMPDFAWGLTEDNYKETIARAKEHARRSVTEGGTISLKFHDPFTRSGYKDGIVLRWLDEMLTWVDAQPEWEVGYATFDEYYDAKRGGGGTKGGE